MWGTAYACPVTVSFWLKTNVAAGSTISVTLNNQGNVNYATSVTVAAAGAWQFCVLTVPGATTGTWSTGATGGLWLMLGGYCTQQNAPASNAWTTGYYNYSGVTNWASTVGNYVSFSGVQLEKGTIATPFEFRPYAVELGLCQRYYEVLLSLTVSSDISNGNGRVPWYYKSQKRSNPAITLLCSLEQTLM